jgi:hypothetical protein
MRPKGYKFIPVTEDYAIAIPEGLPPEQEAALIAQRLAEIDPTELARDCKDLKESIAHPEQCVSLEDILRELEAMDRTTGANPT